MASSLAEERNPQVLMTAMSAPSGASVRVCPASRQRDIICSQLTTFLAQPREMKWSLYGMTVSFCRPSGGRR